MRGIVTKRLLLWSLLLSALPVAWAIAQQIPTTGAEFPVNLTTVGPQTAPTVSADATGNFVVVWESEQDGSGLGLMGRRFDPSGAPLGDEFQVNAFTSSRQSQPSVAADAAGNFVVVWESEGQDGSGDGVFGRVFTAASTPASGEFQVNSFTPGPQFRPAVSADGAGNFVVVWESEGQDGGGPGIYGRRFSPTGASVGGEFQINMFTSNAQQNPSVSSSVSGSFVVVWQSAEQDGSGDAVVGRLYDAAGLPIGEEFVVNSFTTDAQKEPVVASDPAGNFIVAWTSQGQDGGGEGVFGQVFDASGARLGGEFRANAVTAESQKGPWVARTSSGHSLVVWTSLGQDGSGEGIFARLFDPSGNPASDEVRINVFTGGNQQAPRVASDGLGNFIVVWQSEGQDGDGFGIMGRR